MAGLTVVLDTSVVVDVLGGFEPAVDYLRGLDAVPACSEVTRVEVLRGIRSAKRRYAELLI